MKGEISVWSSALGVSFYKLFTRAGSTSVGESIVDPWLASHPDWHGKNHAPELLVPRKAWRSIISSWVRTLTKLITFEESLLLPEDKCEEIIEGVSRRMPRASYTTQIHCDGSSWR